jgi:heat-inducible transcriptional repressor
VLVLQGGIILQRILNVPQLLTPEELRQLSNRLTDTMSGLDIAAIRTKLPELSPLQTSFAKEAIDMMDSMDTRREMEIFRDGLLNILNQPEYVEARNIRQLVGVLESDTFLETLLAEAVPSSGVQIIIGGEGRWNELSDCSLVMARYGIVNEAVGSLGLLGPLRMPYGRAVSTVRYVSDVLSELIHQLYGLPPENDGLSDATTDAPQEYN